MQLEQVQKQFPFLTCIRHATQEFVCIVQNADDKFITFYDYATLNGEQDRHLFLEFGEIWWLESNRTIPINIFLRGQMEQFRYVLRTASMKDVEVLFGPVTSLNNIIKKRIKRRQIQLIRKL